jgi:hypothetical protein
MGTSLTGLTPSTTYDALIKVGDNGPLSATAKVLSDGLGNDSVLALSTTAIGIGTTTPTQKLSIAAPSALMDITSTTGTSFNGLEFKNTSGSFYIGQDNSTGSFYGSGTAYATSLYNSANTPMVFFNNSAERMRITATGNVGIGTSTPSAKLTVVGTGEYDGVIIVRSTGSGTPQAVLGVDAVGSGLGYVGTVNNIPLQIRTNDVTRLRVDADGLKFGSDTAAANALDDYEEGTFTATMTGSISNPTTAVTTTASYTKIGRQVTVSIMFANVNTTGASGAVRIAGLPFSCAIEGTGAVTCELFTLGLTRTSVNSWVGSSSPTTVNLFVSGNDTSFENLGHNPGSGRYLYTSLTYFV